MVGGGSRGYVGVLLRTLCGFPGEHERCLPLLRLEDVYGCPYDFIEVFDGRQAASLSMGKFCAEAELTFLSSSNILTTVFRSDSMVTNVGFYALYSAILQDEKHSGGYPSRHTGGKMGLICTYSL